MSPYAAIPLMALGGALVVRPVRVATAQRLTPADRATAVATVWATARQHYAYWERVRADWDSALTATLALAAERQSDVRFYERLRRMVALLGDGQATLAPSPDVGARIARPPLLLRSVERRVFLIDYYENDEMRVARPERLAAVFAVQGVPAQSWIRDTVLPGEAAAQPEARWQRAAERMLEGPRGLVARPVPASARRAPQYWPARRAAGWPAADSAAAVRAPSDTVRPRADRPAFAGPVAVLVSARTQSGAEDFLVAFLNAERGLLIGERSAGSAGRTLTVPLPGGWRFRLTVSRDALGDGSEFFGVGIAPDVRVAPTIEDLLVGRDAALERAREYVRSRSSP